MCITTFGIYTVAERIQYCLFFQIFSVYSNFTSFSTLVIWFESLSLLYAEWCLLTIIDIWTVRIHIRLHIRAFMPHYRRPEGQNICKTIGNNWKSYLLSDEHEPFASTFGEKTREKNTYVRYTSQCMKYIFTKTCMYYCDQIERWILNLNFPGFSKLKFFFSISW